MSPSHSLLSRSPTKLINIYINTTQKPTNNTHFKGYVQLYKFTISSLLVLYLPFIPLSVCAECTCESEPENTDNNNKNKALKFKLVTISSILIVSALGVSLPILSKRISTFRPENNIFFLIKAFAAGVILATSFVHILPDAFDNLTSPCLSEHPRRDFPFVGFVAMMSAIGTMMIDVFTTSYYKRSHFNKALPVNDDEEMQREHEGHVHVHTIQLQHMGMHMNMTLVLPLQTHSSATHGHAHVAGFFGENSWSSDLVMHRAISQVLELGIVVHSIIIGISLSASQNAKTVKPLVAALTFHQFFEGMGLGRCIYQEKFKSKGIVIMVLFFSLTTPVCIAIGIGIPKIYDENSPKALIVEGIFNSASAGILIYMALVDLLATDFMNPRMQGNLKLQLGVNFYFLLLGTGSMSLLAKWA